MQSKSNNSSGAVAPLDAASQEMQDRVAELQGQIDAISRSMAVIEFDLDGTVLHANQNFLATLGYRLEEIVGKHHRIFVEQRYASSKEYRDFWAALGRGELRQDLEGLVE